MDKQIPISISINSLQVDDSSEAFSSYKLSSSSSISHDPSNNFLTYSESEVGVQDSLEEFSELETGQGNLSESYASIQSSSHQSQVQERFPLERGSNSLIDEHASSSNSLVFNHLKVLLSELDIPDNDSPKYHVAWAFDPPFAKPKPSPAFDGIALEVEQIRIIRTMLGRINMLWRSNVSNRRLKSRSSYYASRRPFWSFFGPVKASTLVNAITVCRRMSGARSV